MRIPWTRIFWLANKYISEPINDGGKPHISALKVKLSNEFQLKININEEKAKILADLFFSRRLAVSTVPPNFHYPQPMNNPLPINKE